MYSREYADNEELAVSQACSETKLNVKAHDGEDLEVIERIGLCTERTQEVQVAL
jgi:hypothetical protein